MGQVGRLTSAAETQVLRQEFPKMWPQWSLTGLSVTGSLVKRSIQMVQCLYSSGRCGSLICGSLSRNRLVDGSIVSAIS